MDFEEEPVDQNMSFNQMMNDENRDVSVIKLESEVPGHNNSRRRLTSTSTVLKKEPIEETKGRPKVKIEHMKKGRSSYVDLSEEESSDYSLSVLQIVKTEAPHSGDSPKYSPRRPVYDPPSLTKTPPKVVKPTLPPRSVKNQLLPKPTKPVLRRVQPKPAEEEKVPPPALNLPPGIPPPPPAAFVPSRTPTQEDSDIHLAKKYEEAKKRQADDDFLKDLDEAELLEVVEGTQDSELAPDDLQAVVNSQPTDVGSLAKFTYKGYSWKTSRFYSWGNLRFRTQDTQTLLFWYMKRIADKTITVPATNVFASELKDPDLDLIPNTHIPSDFMDSRINQVFNIGGEPDGMAKVLTEEFRTILDFIKLIDDFESCCPDWQDKLATLFERCTAYMDSIRIAPRGKTTV
jgi:hypothetical protein